MWTTWKKKLISQNYGLNHSRTILNPCLQGLGTTQHREPCEHHASFSCRVLTSHSLILRSLIGSTSADSEASFFLTTMKAGSCPIPLMPSPYMSGLHCMKNTKRWSDLKRATEQGRKINVDGKVSTLWGNILADWWHFHFGGSYRSHKKPIKFRTDILIWKNEETRFS